MNRKKHSIDVVFVLVLFCTFAVSVLMVLMVGASSYNHVTDLMDSNYEDRTGAGYIAEKVRHGDSCGSIGTGSFQGQQALILTQDIGGSQYATYIYYYDGCIRELFTETDNDLPPEAGEKIIEAAGFEVQEYDGGLIRVTCRMEDGSAPYVILSPRTRDQGLKTAAEQISGKGAGDEQA